MAASRWIVALASLYIMISSGGSLNTFSLYSQHIKTSLGYNQEAINTISFFKELGTAAGIVSGLVYGFSGPWLLLLIGSVLNLLGYVMIWLSVTHSISNPQVWQLSFYICIVGASVAFTTTAVIVVCATNFPKNQSMILSLLDSTQGLSGATFTLLFQAWFTTRPGSFILLLGWFPSALPLILIYLVREVPEGKYKDTQILYRTITLVVLLALYMMLVIVLQHVFNLEIRVVRALFFVMLLITGLPVAIVFSAELQQRKLGASSVQEVPEDANNGSVSPSNEGKGPQHGDEFSIFQAVCSLDMWLIFIATTCGIGAALTVYNNLGQIGVALGYSQLHTNTFVALLSIWDFLGGVGCGFLSDVLLRKRGIPRPLFLAIVLAILGMGILVIGLAIPGALFLGSIMVGVSIGAQWAVLYTIIAEIFGMKNYGTLQNFTYVAKAVGTYLLSVKLAGALYDRRANDKGMDGAVECVGSHCYRTTCFVMAACCLVACLMSTVLTIRTRRFYKDVLKPRLCSRPEDIHPQTDHDFPL